VALQVIGKKVAAVCYQLDDLLSSFPMHASMAGDATGDALQPMQVDS
jgi:hypothetical protein